MTTTLDIQLNGSHYPVACSEAEAPRTQEVAQQLQKRIAQLRADLGGAQISDAHLFALMGLILMDEVADLSAVTAAKAEAQSKSVPAAAPIAAKTDSSGETELFINAVSHLTDRVNLIAQKLRAA